MRSSIIILTLAPTVLSLTTLNVRHAAVARRAVAQDFNLDAAAVFPHAPMEKRALVGGLLSAVGGVVDTAVSPLIATTTTTTPPVVVPGVTTTATPSSSNAQAENPSAANPTTTNNNSQNNPTDNSGASPAPAAGVNPSNAASTSTAPSGIAKDGTGGNSSAGSAGSVIPRVITDHAGNTMTITAPVTMTWVTTLPNGVVSTVTETFTPDAVPGPSSDQSMAASKIAAIVGTIIAVFLIIFTVAFVFLMMRKRQKRSIQLTGSRPTSMSSFGSASDEWAHNEHRNSRTGLAASQSTPSFRTASEFVNGTKSDSPLPLVPTVPSRPVSGQSDLTFDFSQHGKSRASIIEDRNRYRKIGQYPDADSYTPFAIPPSDLSHTEESFGSPQASMIGEKSAENNFHEAYRSSKNYDLVTIGENPFSDPVTIPQASYAPTSKPLANDNARRSSLWRTTSIGATPRASSPSRNTLMSLASSEYSTAQDHGDMSDSASSNDSLSRRPSASTGRYSYHSAFETYAQANNSRFAPATENPFVDQPSQTQNFSSQPVAYPALRPNTAASSAGTSIMSGGNRDLGATPDPKDLFYRSFSQIRASEDSRASTDGGATVRTRHITYPRVV